MPEQNTVLRFENASLRWSRRKGDAIQALAPTSFTLEAGDRAVIRGPSGSGKTTLLLLAGGMLHPTTGRIDHPSKVGFVFQTLELLPYLTVRENIALGATRQVSHETLELDPLLEELGLQARADHRPHELSTGECQRTATARALVSNPTLILADEPTGNLDDENAEIVLHALSRQTERGASLLLVTHGPLHQLEPTRSMTLKEGVLTEAGGASG